MARCLELAKRGAGNVAPNPMVGAVLVHEGSIIGEGYHKKYGGAHAEVNCINDALRKAPELISSSVLYVSLEPCSHFGKTPPCTDLIMQHSIPHVVIGCRDSFNEVNGKGIEKLKAAGIKITEGVLEKEAIELNKRFFTFYEQQRPYVVLKWAQTNDGFISVNDSRRLMISNAFTNRLVHKWRSEEAGILVGANTAINDDPLLDNRNWFGKSPIKIIIDPDLKCPSGLRLYQEGADVFVFNKTVDDGNGRIKFVKVKNDDFLISTLKKLHELKLLSVLVEGGAQTLQYFFDAGLWDEARVITNKSLIVEKGLKAPRLKNARKTKEELILNDRLEYFKNAGTGLL